MALAAAIRADSDFPFSTISAKALIAAGA